MTDEYGTDGVDTAYRAVGQIQRKRDLTVPYTEYANLGGNSGVESTRSERGKLHVRFSDGSRYTYTNKSAGQYSMRRMRQLAERGQGLNAYINTSVGKNYASKRRR